MIQSNEYRHGMYPGSQNLLKRQPERIGSLYLNVLFYKGTPSETAYFVDLKNEDEQIRACVFAFQGLVARERCSSIYITVSPEDDMWAEYLTKDYGTVFKTVTLPELFQEYGELVKKLILYKWDPDRDTAYEYNIALMMAAQTDGLPVTEPVLAKLSAWGITCETEDISGRFSGRAEAYEFAIKELLPGCNKNYVAATGYWHYFNDYVYATKTFSFMLSIKEKSECAVLDTLLEDERFVRPAIVFGYGQEGDDLLLESIKYGFSYIVNDYFANSTFFSSYPMAEVPYVQAPQSPVDAENGKVYIGLYFSDGDNLQFNQRLSSCIFRNTDKGTNPAGMQINPVLFEIAPPMLKWYYDRLSPNDELVGGPAGFSYVWEHNFREDCWPMWHEYNNFYLNMAGIRETNTSNILQKPEFADSFTKLTKAVGSYVWHSGVFDCDYIPYGKPYMFNGVPLVITACITYSKDLHAKITENQPETDKPKFVGICLTQAGVGENAYTDVKKIVEQVKREHPGEYEFLLPTEMMLTVKKWMEK